MRARLQAGSTQAEVAERMGTTQSVISRAESGQVMPTIEFIQRFADATAQEISIVVTPGDSRAPKKSTDLRRRARAATGDFVFNPWDREPTEAEAKSLLADGLTRERFEGKRASKSR